MEECLNEIIGNLEEFFKVMQRYFFKHQNKYIRKFSMQVVSYVLVNLEEERFNQLLGLFLQ